MSNDPNFLDVEDDEQRRNRIDTLLRQLNTTPPAFPTDLSNGLLSIGHDYIPGPIEPPTELLARIQAFLHAIHASNEALTQANPEDIDIENVTEEEERYIEMNLGLGVFETKRSKKGGSPSSSEQSSSESSLESSDEDSDSSSSASDDSDSSENGTDSQSESVSSIDMRPILSRQLKPLPRRVSQQAKIEDLGSLPESTSGVDIT